MSGPEKLGKYDSALLGILQHEGELEPFLDIMFGFLFRKTDFYCIMKDSKQKFGFPPGVAEKLIMKYFQKYQSLTVKMQNQAASNEKKRAEKEESKVTEIVEEETTPSSTESVQKSNENGASGSEKEPEEVGAEVEVKELLTDQEQFQSNPDSYNGAVRERYSWSQNYDDVDVVVPVSKSILKGNQVKVDIKRKHLLVLVKNDDGKMETVIDDELKHEVLKEESMWSLEGGKNIEITLAKDTKFWWNSLLLNEEEIDVKKIKPERSMQDMQEDELAVINKLQFDERQKRLGLPQSHEMKVHEMLKKGWDAEGSPFKGQDFDPKMFNVSPSGVQ